MAELSLEQVSKVYRPRGRPQVRAVSSLTMQVRHGEIVALLGSSGCGKTSTLRMVAGFESVTEGTVRLGARALNDLRPAQRNVAMAFEGYSLYPPLRLRDNIAFALLRDRIPRATVEARVAEIAALLELEPALQRYPGTISAGLQQRASLARALIRSADLYLLDEPMSQLEPQMRAILRARIKEWLKDRAMTAVIVTHDQTDAMALADRIAVMEASELMQYGTPAELRERPANLFVAGFIGEPPMNLMPAAAAGSDGGLRIAAGEGALTLQLPQAAVQAANGLGSNGTGAGSGISLGINPRHIRIGSGALAGKVIANQWLGDQTHVALEVGGMPIIAVAEGQVPARPGETVPFEIAPQGIHLFEAERGRALFHGSSLGEGP
ncbi:MAG: ABC transporter ATP-binding protein [Kiloniellales bacterium]